MYYVNYFFIFSIIGHFIETVFVKNFESGILFGWWTPVYGIGIVLILWIGKLVNRIKLDQKIIIKIGITYLLSMILLSLIELLGGYLIEWLFHQEFWNYEKHKFHLGPYISLEMANIWGISSIFVLYVLKPIIDKVERHIPKLVTYLLILLFLIDVIFTLLYK